MPSIIPSFFDLPREVERAKKYVVDSFSAHQIVLPLLSFYQQDALIFSLIFPFAESQEEKQTNFTRASWVNGIVRANGVRFIIDSSVSMKNDLDEDYQQDLILIFFSNKLGCFIVPCCYVYSHDTNSIEWVERNIDEKLVMESQPAIVNMLAGQFFFSPNSIPWTEYVEYLEENKFVFEYYNTTKSLLDYAQETLY